MSKEALEKIKVLEALIEEDNCVLKQFVMRSKVFAGKMANNEIIEYDSDEKISMLLDALRMTSPRCDLDEINKGFYGINEIKIINQIALTYSDNNEYCKAADIYNQILKYALNHYKTRHGTDPIIILIAYNYSRVLYQQNRFSEAIEVAELGWENSIILGRSSYLGSLMMMIGLSYINLDQLSKGLEFLEHAYHIYVVTKDIHIDLASQWIYKVRKMMDQTK